MIRHNNKTYQEKKVGEGHYLDRRSGTGRVYIIIHLVTNLAKKAEDTEALETSRISSTEISIFKKALRSHPLRKQPIKPKLPNKLNLLNLSPNNPKPSPLRNITRTKEFKSIILMRRKPQPRK